MKNDPKQSFASGKIVIYPAESIYGIGCSVKSTDSIKKIFDFKQRESGQGFIILSNSILSVKNLIANEHKIDDIEKNWPQNTTYVFKASENAPTELCDTRFGKTIAIRITQHDFLKALCFEVGPIISTSANPKGRPVPRKFCDIERSVKNIADSYIINDNFTLQEPSKIIDFSSGKVIR